VIEAAIMTDPITPTGRLVFPAAELGREMQRALSGDGSFTFTMEWPLLDFTIVEQHALALMLNGTGQPEGAIVLDLESRGGELRGPLDILQEMMDNFQATARVENRQLSLYARGALAEKVARLEKPTKPNGRSLDYLRHDPTKKHRRGRA
jgi:hypothetical protein